MVKDRVGQIPALTPNWASPVKAQFQFSTEVFETRDGSEQRWSHRQEPRLKVQYSALAQIEEWARIQADMLAGGQADTFVIAIPWRKAELSATASSTTLSFSSLPFWAVAGAKVILEDDTNVEVAEIDSVGGTDATLTTALTNTFAAGSKVYQAQDSLVQESLEASFVTDRVATMETDFSVFPGVTPHGFATISPDQHNSKDLFLIPKNWGSPTSTRVIDRRRTFDLGRGRVTSTSWNPRSDLVRKVGLSLTTAEAAEELIAFFHKHKGQRGSFYAPTTTTDFVALSSELSGSNSLTVSGTDFHDAFTGHSIYDRAYVKVGSSYQVNEISSIATSGGNSVLTMADVWGFDIPQNQPFSWCPLSRFASDTLAPEWVTDEVVEVAVSFQTVKNIG